MNDSGYRLNVGLIVANKQGKVLLCKRKGVNSWQFPQGGIDYAENSLKAAKRELLEEVGIRSKSRVDLVDFDLDLVPGSRLEISSKVRQNSSRNSFQK